MGYTYVPQVSEGYVLSDANIGQSLSEQSTNNLFYTKLKTILNLKEIYPLSQLRFRWDMHSGVLGQMAYTKIGLSGNLIGAEQIMAGTGYSVKSVDLAFTNIRAQDTIEVWGHVDDVGNSVYVQNFYIRGNNVTWVEI